ncbi:unnamed protein product [Adineta steineri]|uniref:Peroxin-5 n=1 Tax=Adineta steineri TaxID=433720 RepID=A0A819KTD6_9BILA|nr:unnamed protein product [Adineta steineri]
MTTFKPLVDAECGTTNPLIKLSELYKEDKKLVIQDGINPSLINFSDTNLTINSDTIVDELVNEYHRPIIAPNTFHLESLLKDLHPSDPQYEWTKQFLDSCSNYDLPSSPPQSLALYEQNYIQSPACFILHPNPIFLDQQPYPIDAEFNNDTVEATNNILSLLQESQFAANTECKTSVNDINVQHDTDTLNKNKRQSDANLSLSNDQTSSSQISSGQINNHNGYKFIQPNPFFDYINPYEEGLKHLEVHDIVNAILFFEAAVQNKHDHADAWLCLGITQSENGQDIHAIDALKKCIELDSKNTQAYITLASCYANKMLKKEALNCLHQWLINHNKYSHLLSNHRLHSIRDIEIIFEDLKNLFLQAILLSKNSNTIDSDLQVCLGILFYLYDDYNKATECFNTAILAKPNDALLWNKLGAAIANSGLNEQAVNAYYHALRLSPGFIRARYNLGKSCLNLNAYRQAIEHFLIALKQQNNVYLQMSDDIWHTLAIAIDCLKRPDLIEYVRYKNLSKLLHEFEIE